MWEFVTLLQTQLSNRNKLINQTLKLTSYCHSALENANTPCIPIVHSALKTRYSFNRKECSTGKRRQSHLKPLESTLNRFKTKIVSSSKLSKLILNDRRELTKIFVVILEKEKRPSSLANHVYSFVFFTCNSYSLTKESRYL